MNIDDLKAQVSITEVLVFMGAEVRPGYGDWKPVKCHMHEDRAASGSVNVQKGKYRCHGGCTDERSWDIVDLAQEWTGEDVRGALRWLEEKFA